MYEGQFRHGDISSNNILVDRNNGQIYLIDWELGGYGPPNPWVLHQGPFAEYADLLSFPMHFPTENERNAFFDGRGLDRKDLIYHVETLHVAELIDLALRHKKEGDLGPIEKLQRERDVYDKILKHDIRTR